LQPTPPLYEAVFDHELHLLLQRLTVLTPRHEGTKV